MVATTILDQHWKELRSNLQTISSQIRSCDRLRKTHPPRYASYLWHSLTDTGSPAWCHYSQGIGQAIRQIHDFYGWKAKGTAAKRGVCSGALYRSGGYLGTDMGLRNGSKSSNRNVHIEHTVPIAIVSSALRSQIGRNASVSDMYDCLLKLSVCTALSDVEERCLRQCGIPNHRHPAFDSTGKPIDDKPFRRYEKLQVRDQTFQIFNVVTGEPIELSEFTFDDHVKTMLLAVERLSGLGTANNIFRLSVWNNAFQQG